MQQCIFVWLIFARVCRRMEEYEKRVEGREIDAGLFLGGRLVALNQEWLVQVGVRFGMFLHARCHIAHTWKKASALTSMCGRAATSARSLKQEWLAQVGVC